MQGTGGLRKARVALENRGKSGGARVCYIDFVFAETVYLITVFGKKEKANLSKEERNNIKKAIEASPELRSKKQLIENFIAGINDVDDVMSEWHDFVVFDG